VEQTLERLAAVGSPGPVPGPMPRVQDRVVTALPPLTTAASSVAIQPGAIDRHVSTDVPVCAPDECADAVRSRLLGLHYSSVADVAVCTGPPHQRQLVGLVPAEVLLSAAEDALARDLMDPEPAIIRRDVDEEKAAWQAARHGQSSLAVVGADGLFHGLVPPGRLLGALVRGHDEDLARLGGYLASTASARHATEEPLHLRLWHRVPWLLVGLLGSAAAAVVVGGFEEELAADVRLVFFLPGIVYMADAVGTQTEALVIRGMSIGVTIRSILRSELLTGGLIGVLLAALALPALAIFTGSTDLAIVVAISLLLACSVATTVAIALPAVMSRFDRDPAFGSGPLATVVQDLLSIILYFAVAKAVLGV
jgi:magnesium transporter